MNITVALFVRSLDRVTQVNNLRSVNDCVTERPGSACASWARRFHCHPFVSLRSGVYSCYSLSLPRRIRKQYSRCLGLIE